MNSLSRIALGVSAIALANAHFAKANLKPVDEDPEVHTDEDNGGGGEGGTETSNNESTAEEDDAAETYEASDFTVSDIPDDVIATARAASIEWGFADWPVGAHRMIPAALVQRARGAIQNVRAPKGKPNGKVFRTLTIKGNAAAEKRNPGFKDGDIEVWRMPDIKVVDDTAPTSSDTENAD